MAGGYIIDPATGMPSVRTASGALLPLPMGQDALTAAGLPPAPMPPVAPDMRVAGPGGGPMAEWGDEIPTLPEPTPQEKQADQVTAIRSALAPAAGASAPTHGMRKEPSKFDAQPRRAPAGPGIDPSELARPSAGGSATPAQGAPDDEAAIRDQLMREAMTPRGGGGGPRQLGVSGETRKMTTFERSMDPEAVALANAAGAAAEQGAGDLAGRMALHQELAYRDQQDEYARRSGQLAAMQERYEAQQKMLQDYTAKRDALEQEAAQMKTPQMDDYWKSKGTVATLLSGLSVALGGALQGLRGGSNPGMDMVNQQIDRWVGEQREAYERAKGRVNAADNQYAKMVQTFGSQNLAEAHLREQAWTVRDRMLQSMAEKVGTPTALEAYQQAKLQSDAQKAALRAQATQGAQVEIEQKLSMQGGGGGAAPKTFRQALAETAEGVKNYRFISGGAEKPDRAITGERSDSLAAALDTVQAADEVVKHVGDMGYAGDDTDDPRSGAIDAIKNNIPGTRQRRSGQDLDQATFVLARGAQQFLGKSDNDAVLAEKQAAGGGSGRERIRAAERLRAKAISKAKVELAGMMPDQRAAFLRALAPDQRAMIESFMQTDARPASTEQPVKVR